MSGSRLRRGRTSVEPLEPEVVDLEDEEENDGEVMIVEEIPKDSDDDIQVLEEDDRGQGQEIVENPLWEGRLRTEMQRTRVKEEVVSPQNSEVGGCCSSSLQKVNIKHEAVEPVVTEPSVKDDTFPSSKNNLEPEVIPPSNLSVDQSEEGSLLLEQSEPNRSDEGDEMVVDPSTTCPAHQNQKEPEPEVSGSIALLDKTEEKVEEASVDQTPDSVPSDELGAVGGSSKDHSPSPPPPETSSGNNGHEQQEEERRLVYMSEPTLHLKSWTNDELTTCEQAIRKRLAQLSTIPGIFENYRARYPPFPPSEDPEDPCPRQMLEQDENGKLTWIMCRDASQRKGDEEDIAEGRNKWGFKSQAGPTLTFAEVILSDVQEVQGMNLLRKKPEDTPKEPEAGPSSSSSPSVQPTTSSANSNDEKRRQEQEAAKEEATLTLRKRSRSTENKTPASLITHDDKGVKWRKTKLGVGVLARRPLAKTDLLPGNVPSKGSGDEQKEEGNLGTGASAGSETRERSHEPSATVSVDKETQSQVEKVVPVPSTSSQMQTVSSQETEEASRPVVPPEVSKPKPPEQQSLAECPIEDNTGWVEGDVWEVDKIVDSHYAKDAAGNERVVYKVKWLGWDKKYSSWLDEADVVSKVLVKEYWRKHAKKIKELNAPILELAPTMDPNTNPVEYVKSFGRFKL